MTNAIELEYILNKMKITKKEFASLLGISLQALYNKLNNKVEFKASEIIKACKVLQLADTDRDKIFFATNVD